MESCPECGHAILDSTPSRKLIAAGPTWSKRWRIACRTLCVLLALDILLFHLPYVITFVISPDFSQYLAYLGPQTWLGRHTSLIMLIVVTLFPTLVIWWLTQPGRTPHVDKETWAPAMARWCMMGVAVLSSVYIVHLGMIPARVAGPGELAMQGHPLIATMLVLVPRVLELLVLISLLRWRRMLSSMLGQTAERAMDHWIIALWCCPMAFELQGPITAFFNLNVSAAYLESMGNLVLLLYWFPQTIALFLLLYRVWTARTMFNFMPEQPREKSRQHSSLRNHRDSITCCLQAAAIWLVLCFLWNTWGGLIRIGLAGDRTIDEWGLDPRTLLLAGIIGGPVALLLPGLIGATGAWRMLNRWLLLLLSMIMLIAWASDFALDAWDLLIPAAGLIAVGCTMLLLHPAPQVDPSHGSG
ncbi:MAG: hypothetical protein P8L37_07865 [Phycisphaerales bacterium]|nr:hypothetical protein [Phycisphaerales bacterium]